MPERIAVEEARGRQESRDGPQSHQGRIYRDREFWRPPLVKKSAVLRRVCRIQGIRSLVATRYTEHSISF